MKIPSRIAILAAAGAAGVLCAPGLSERGTLYAQARTRSAATDSRWLPWLGCWQSDSVGDARSATPATTCVVPAAGSGNVDILTVRGGAVESRRRLEANGQPHRVSEQGCEGFESVRWSANGHRAYVRSDYTCAGGGKGTSSTLLGISSTGEWLHVAEIRSGDGAIVSVDRRHAVRVEGNVPAEIARLTGRLQLASATARAAAAAPISADEIIEALHGLDATFVRSWLLTSGQPFDLDQHQLVALARAGVPPMVMQVVMSTPARYHDSLATAADRNADAYLNTRVYDRSITAQGAEASYPRMTTLRVCPPTGCENPNAYSHYNGASAYAYPAYAYPAYTYPYPPVVYPYGYAGRVIDRRDERHERHERSGSERAHPAAPRGPVGRRP